MQVAEKLDWKGLKQDVPHSSDLVLFLNGVAMF
jgi:hypothetical protein